MDSYFESRDDGYVMVPAAIKLIGSESSDLAPDFTPKTASTIAGIHKELTGLLPNTGLVLLVKDKRTESAASEGLVLETGVLNASPGLYDRIKAYPEILVPVNYRIIMRGYPFHELGWRRDGGSITINHLDLNSAKEIRVCVGDQVESYFKHNEITLDYALALRALGLDVPEDRRAELIEAQSGLVEQLVDAHNSGRSFNPGLLESARRLRLDKLDSIAAWEKVPRPQVEKIAAGLNH